MLKFSFEVTKNTLRCFVVAKHYCRSLAAYNELAAVAVKDYPFLKPNDIECGRVTNSDCLDRATMVTFTVPINLVLGEYIHHIDFGWD